MFSAAVKWLFRPSRPHQAGQETNVATVTDLAARLTALERQSAELVDMRLQWTEVLDKLQRWTNRQNARDAARLKSELGKLSETSEDAPGDTISPPAGGNTHDLKNALRARLRAQNGGGLR